MPEDWLKLNPGRVLLLKFSAAAVVWALGFVLVAVYLSRWALFGYFTASVGLGFFITLWLSLGDKSRF